MATYNFSALSNGQAISFNANSDVLNFDQTAICAGNDTVGGNDGNDWVEGGAGNDTISGGSGQDSFAFHESGAANADILNDFAGNWDNIQLDAAAFTAIGATGRFASNDVRFYAAA